MILQLVLYGVEITAMKISTQQLQWCSEELDVPVSFVHRTKMVAEKLDYQVGGVIYSGCGQTIETLERDPGSITSMVRNKEFPWVPLSGKAVFKREQNNF